MTPLEPQSEAENRIKEWAKKLHDHDSSFRQEILMYVRDEIISPIMPPVKKYEKKLDVWLKRRDSVLIGKLAKKHTDALIAIIQDHINQKVIEELKGLIADPSTNTAQKVQARIEELSTKSKATDK